VVGASCPPDVGRAALVELIVGGHTAVAGSKVQGRRAGVDRAVGQVDAAYIARLEKVDQGEGTWPPQKDRTGDVVVQVGEVDSNGRIVLLDPAPS
jgi:hypothetical protein